MEVLERALERQLTADEVHAEIQTRLALFTPELQQRLGVVATEPVEILVPGPHRLFVIDETQQQTGNFKYNGAAFAVHQALRENPDTDIFFTGTAGNFGAALAQAATAAGKKAVLLAPNTLPAPKQRNMELAGGEVHKVSTDVVGAIAVAETVACEGERRAFIHPFNDLDAIAGQAAVASRVATTLSQLQGPKTVLVQRGGGSLLSGFASMLQARSGDTQLLEVRPERVDGKLDNRYDGLAVDHPGSYAAALLSDETFVHGRVEVSEADTGRAAHRMARALRRRFEPSGLAGVAAFERIATDNSVPTTYFAVLSGANVAPETYADFMDAPRREQMRILSSLALESEVEMDVTKTARPQNHTWSSPTAAWR